MPPVVAAVGTLMRERRAELHLEYKEAKAVMERLLT